MLANWWPGHLSNCLLRDLSNCLLSIDDVELLPSMVWTTLQHSKSDQKGRDTLISLETGSNTALCPIEALQQYLAIRGREKNNLFHHRDGTSLIRYQFWAVMKEALERMGLHRCQFSTHFFRIGDMSTAVALGYSSDDTGKLGRWRSSCYKIYVRKCTV